MIYQSDLWLSYLFRFVGRRFYAAQIETATKQVEARTTLLQIYSSIDFNELVIALVVAEDRRFFRHFGVDYYGIARAIFAYTTKRQVQGASTITQQLVRVIVNDYRFSFQRKLKEICIAVEIDRILDKESQARLYLLLGYYGWRMNGLTAAMTRLCISFPCSTEQAAQIIARLKYPEPEHSSVHQSNRIDRRASHLCNLIQEYRDGF